MKKLLIATIVFVVLGIAGACLYVSAKPVATEATEATEVTEATAQPSVVAPVEKAEMMTLDSFFGKYGWSLVPDFQAVAFNQESRTLRVIYHGKMVILAHDSTTVAYLGKADGNSMKFTSYPMFSQEFYDAVAGKDMVVMSTTTDNGLLALVAIPAEVMPKTADETKWDGSEMSFSVWSEPKSPMVIQDTATGEFLVMPEAFGFDSITGDPVAIQPGQSGQGTISFKMTVDDGLAMYVK
jgi:hypothetical protein